MVVMISLVLLASTFSLYAMHEKDYKKVLEKVLIDLSYNTVQNVENKIIEIFNNCPPNLGFPERTQEDKNTFKKCIKYGVAKKINPFKVSDEILLGLNVAPCTTHTLCKIKTCVGKWEYIYDPNNKSCHEDVSFVRRYIGALLFWQFCVETGDEKWNFNRMCYLPIKYYPVKVARNPICLLPKAQRIKLIQQQIESKLSQSEPLCSVSIVRKEESSRGKGCCLLL